MSTRAAVLLRWAEHKVQKLFEHVGVVGAEQHIEVLIRSVQLTIHAVFEKESSKAQHGHKKVAIMWRKRGGLHRKQRRMVADALEDVIEAVKHSDPCIQIAAWPCPLVYATKT